MADFTGIAAVGSSLEKYLRHSFSTRAPIPNTATKVFLARTEDLNAETSDLITLPSLAIYLYRADFNRIMRAAWANVAAREGDARLPLDLHYLFIAYGSNADQEYRILGRTLQAMENMPIFSGPLLDPITDWQPHDAVQVTLEELTTEDVMRTFDSLPVDYKLSIPYVARITVIDGRQAQASLPVTQSISRSRPEVGV